MFCTTFVDIQEASGDHRCVSGCLSLDFPIKSDSLKTRETRLTDIKTPFLGPGVAAASERTAILDSFLLIAIQLIHCKWDMCPLADY